MLNTLRQEWLSVPSNVREAIRSALVSFWFTLLNVFYALYIAYTVLCDQTHAVVTFVGYLAFVKLSWGATAMGILAAAYRVQQSNKKSQNTFVADGTPLAPGTQYVVIKPTTDAPAGAQKPT